MSTVHENAERLAADNAALRASVAELEGERAEAEAEAKRYREALGHIARMAHPQFSAEIARKALEGGE